MRPFCILFAIVLVNCMASHKFTVSHTFAGSVLQTNIVERMPVDQQPSDICVTAKCDTDTIYSLKLDPNYNLREFTIDNLLKYSMTDQQAFGEALSTLLQGIFKIRGIAWSSTPRTIIHRLILQIDRRIQDIYPEISDASALLEGMSDIGNLYSILHPTISERMGAVLTYVSDMCRPSHTFVRQDLYSYECTDDDCALPNLYLMHAYVMGNYDMTSIPQQLKNGHKLIFWNEEGDGMQTIRTNLILKSENGTIKAAWTTNRGNLSELSTVHKTSFITSMAMLVKAVHVYLDQENRCRLMLSCAKALDMDVNSPLVFDPGVVELVEVMNAPANVSSNVDMINKLLRLVVLPVLIFKYFACFV